MGLREDIQYAINRNSAENGSNTPDFILADYLVGCLAAFDLAISARTRWWGESKDPVDLPELPKETRTETRPKEMRNEDAG